MTKKFLAVSFLSLMLAACGGGNSSGNSGSGALELSQRDKELANISSKGNFTRSKEWKIDRRRTI